MTTMRRLDASRMWGIGSLDGPGAGDHDLPYRFGRRLTSRVPETVLTNMLRDAPLVFERLQAESPQAVDLMGRLVECAGGTG
jgi:hypothetical protein